MWFMYLEVSYLCGVIKKSKIRYSEIISYKLGKVTLKEGVCLKHISVINICWAGSLYKKLSFALCFSRVEVY